MVQTVIIGFLIGAVLSSAFRVWALIPLTWVIFLSVTCYGLYQGQSAPWAIGNGFLIALAPQAGYAFGLTINGVLLALRSPIKPPLGRFAPRNPPRGT
jgi:hypothetical protein